ncbi:MAG: hypothetical protein ACLGHN_07605 [Bacteriovoracia bacterium]
MKNSNPYILAVVLLLTGCIQKKPETLISRWEKKVSEDNVVERKLASSASGQCLNDIFSVETLKAEVIELERKYAHAEKVKGTWKHLNLQDLPVPQANFLKAYGDKIGDLRNPDSIDYSSCEDVPCIYNKIYEKNNDVAGYVHYLWYLKFGNMLSADNLSPVQSSKIAGEYNGKVFPLKDYLFDRKELYGLWRLSLMLRTPHTTLSYLKEVQRIPRGQRFEGKGYEMACGLAYSQGWILLNDGCLTVYEYNKDDGFLYQAVTHELTHQVDFEQGRGSRKFYRSHKDDYLTLAGMFLKEFVDEEGKTQRQWEHKPGIKLVSSYAGTSPEENFAESIAVFRVDGDKAKKNVTDEHYTFVSNDYYQNRAFHKEALIASWIQNYSSDASKAVFKAVVDCSKEPATPKSSYFKNSDFSYPVLPGMINCIGHKAVEISNTLRAKATLYEPEGCLRKNEKSSQDLWNSLMKDHLKISFDQYLKELSKDKEYLARIDKYYKQVSDKTIARNAYVNCFGESDEENCFQEKLRSDAFDNALTLGLPETQTKEMAEMYVSYHSFQATREDTLKHYQIFVSSNNDMMRREADSIWEGCHSINHNDDETPTGNLFQVGSGYMISSFYNCINLNLPQTITEAVRNISVDGFKIQHPKEEVILHHFVKPQIISMLKEKYSDEKQKEEKASVEVIASDKGQVRSKLLSDFSWVTNIVDQNQIMSDCKKEGYRLLPFPALYHLKSELFSSYLEKSACLNIHSTNEFNKWLSSSKEEFNEKVLSGLESKVTELAVLQAGKCLEKYPMNSVISKLRYRKQREACLMDEWPSMESKVLKEASADPVVIKLQISSEVLQDKLEINRRRLQLRIIKEHFN